jgi:hypothetical protein
LFAAFHLASLAAAPALSAAAFVAMHLAAHLSAFIGHATKIETFDQAMPRKPRWRVRPAEDDEVDETLLGLGTEKDGSSGN